MCTSTQVNMKNRIQRGYSRPLLKSSERRDKKITCKGIHTQVFVRLSLHCICRTCDNAAVTLPMVSAVSPIEAKFGVVRDESAVNHRDKDCKVVCKACDDSSKTMSGEVWKLSWENKVESDIKAELPTPRISGVDDWVSCGGFQD